MSKLEQSPQLEIIKGVQASKKRDDALKPLIDAVVYGGFLCHKDKDVKLLVAICVTELLGVMAPEPPNLQCAPHMLLAVIPSLIEELSADQFLRRFSDKSVDVRNSALQCAKAFYAADLFGRESLEMITSVEGQLLDFDDRVRMQTVTVACDICGSNLKRAPLKLMAKVGCGASPDLEVTGKPHIFYLVQEKNMKNIKNLSKEVEKKDWEGATCSVCMEVPHNVVLLL
ncbi:hypothetical protein KIW84_075094 [Lathyrus oleraceus]|uniref:Uncharacterized protein n=1 Tax=Pisum sativum TaxID=3888 RepID=A0A9D4VVS3_PEA|nr:hypothetical protein KIW84_075094 [Pisum sativum]